MLRWFKAILLLPANVLVFIPALILALGRYHISITDNPVLLIIGMVFAVTGLCLALWTMLLFDEHGKGTAAPWDPPRKLVVVGPYRHVRNPMITSVFMMLTAEVLLTTSLPLFIWACIFVTLNLFYLPKIEEPELEKRFGKDYTLYKNNVPRWVPRLRPWTLPKK